MDDARTADVAACMSGRPPKVQAAIERHKDPTFVHATQDERLADLQLIGDYFLEQDQC